MTNFFPAHSRTSPGSHLAQQIVRIAFLLAFFGGICTHAPAQADIRLIPQFKLGSLNTYAFSPDGKWLAQSGSDYTAIWDLTSNIQAQILPKPYSEKRDSLKRLMLEASDTYLAMAFVPNGNLLAGLRETREKFIRPNVTSDEFIKYDLLVWDLKKNIPQFSITFEFRYEERYIDHCALAVSADGKVLALAMFLRNGNDSYFYLRAYDLRNGSILMHHVSQDKEFQWYDQLVDLHISPDGQNLMVGFGFDADPDEKQKESRVEVWRLGDKQPATVLKPGKPAGGSILRALELDAESRYLYAAFEPGGNTGDSLIYISRWDAQTWQLAPQKGQGNFFKTFKGDFARADDNEYFDFSSDLQYFKIPDVGIFNLNGSAGPPPYNSQMEGGFAPRRTCTLFNGETFYYPLSGRSDKLPAYQSRRKQEEVVFGKNGVLHWRDGGQFIWDLSVLHGESWFTGLDIYNGGFGAFWMEDRYDQKKGQVFFHPKSGRKIPIGDLVTDCRFSPNGQYAIGKNAIFRFDGQLFRLLRKIENMETDYVAFDPTEKFIFVFRRGSDQECRTCMMAELRTLPECNIVRKFVVPDRIDWSVAEIKKAVVSASGQWLAVLNDITTIQLFDIQTGKVIRTLKGAYSDLAFSSDGQQLLAVRFEGIDIYALPSFDLQETWNTGFRSNYTLDFDPEGKRLVTGGDGALKIWEWPARKLIVTAVLSAIQGDERSAMLYTPDGYYYATKGLERQFAFLASGQYLPFEQFDIFYNRPDIVLSRLGYAIPPYLERLKRACQLRMEKTGIDPNAKPLASQLPQVNIQNLPELPLTTSQRKIKLNIKHPTLNGRLHVSRSTSMKCRFFWRRRQVNRPDPVLFWRI
ncbi:MAG: WD40 repeat domain-containing protein [Saprospiraceae bacterium]|nr:WD40 repeat domain-containing protein [Saprospiraceae bacterium]